MSRVKDGIYRRDHHLFAFRYKDKTGVWREKRTGTDDREEAKKIKAEFENNLKDGTLPTEKARWTVEQAATEWCHFHAVHLKSSKWRSNEKSYCRRSVKVLGHRRLQDITIDDLSRYKLRRSQKVGAVCINRELRILVSVLKSANLWKPIAGHYKPLPEEEGEVGRALTR